MTNSGLLQNRNLSNSQIQPKSRRAFSVQVVKNSQKLYRFFTDLFTRRGRGSCIWLYLVGFGWTRTGIVGLVRKVTWIWSDILRSVARPGKLLKQLESRRCRWSTSLKRGVNEMGGQGYYALFLITVFIQF